MSRKGEKALLLFSTGEITPLLAARTDVERVVSGCRTLQNMVIETAGPVTRRPGLQYVAPLRSIVFDYISYEGSGTMYGITEFGDLSDPPRKYLLLESNKAAVARLAASLTPDVIASWNYNRAAYENTAGTRTEEIGFINGNVTSGILADVVKQLGSVGGETLDGNENSFEDVVQPSDWLPFPPSWTRNKTEKYFAEADIDPASGETRYLYHLANSFGSVGGTNGTSRGLGVRDLTFVTDHWEMIVDVGGDGVSLGTAVGPSAYVKVANGNQDPGTVATTDQFLGRAADVPANNGNCGGSFPLSLPPDCSVRFLVVRSGFQDQVPQPIGTVYTNGVVGASGLTVAGYDGWLYLPPTNTLPWRYASKLANEDTMEAALIRGAVSPGTEDTAETSALAGGTTAESVVPITFTSRTSRVFKTFTGLTIGNRYEWTVNLRTTLITGGSATDSAFSDEFVATATFEAVSYLMKAPLGYSQRTLSFSIVDEGADPVVPAYQSETLVAYGKVLDAGSTWSAAQLTLANNLVLGLKSGLGASFSKLVYVLPLIGSDIISALVPLIDIFQFGTPTNTAFVNADFSQTTGLQGNGSSKRLTLPFKASQIGNTTNGGVGFWSLAFSAAGTAGDFAEAFWNAGFTQIFGVSLGNGGGNQRVFYWGGTANGAAVSGAGMVGDVYGQRMSATDRKLYLDAVELASNTTSDSGSSAADGNIPLMGDNLGTRYYAGRMGLAYATDGNLSGAEITALHTALVNFMTAASRS